MFRKFPDLLLRLCLLPQEMWLLPSWGLLCMSFPSSRGVTRSLTTSLGSIQIGTLGGFTVYPHPLIVNPAPELDNVTPRPVYQDILVDQEWARHPPDPLQVIRSIKGKVEHAMQIPGVVSNPLFFSILEGLRTDYSVFDHQQVPRRRSRSHSPQEQQ